MKPDNVSHPYHPRDLHIPHYSPNDRSIEELLGLFFSLAAVVVVITWIYTSKRKFPVADRLKLCWFVVCGFIHTILEGYFSLFHATLAGESTYLAQMWKEYGKGDSRYIISDPFMVSMESITAFVDGPLCFLTVAAFLNKQPSQYRYVLQLLVSVLQLYGDTLYYFTAVVDGFKHSEMWHPLHFWFYFCFLNAFWIIIPLCYIYQAATVLGKGQSVADNSSSPQKTKSSFGKSKKKKQ